MTRRSAIRTIMIAGAVASGSRLGAITQQSQDFIIRSDVRLVLLDVTVKDRTGGLVRNLSRDDFTVLENGQPEHLTVFSDDDVPITVGLLVDESRSMLAKRNDVLMAAGDFIRTSNPEDEFFVLNFNDTVKRGLPSSMLFSDNMSQLRAALDRGVPRGMTALDDAVVDGLEQLKLGNREHKALVIISDGGDNASVHTQSEMFAMLERSSATIYAVGLVDPEDADWNPGILRHLAHVSGGEAVFLSDTAILAATCEKIAKEIRTRYTLGYPPPPGKAGSLRHIQVRISAPGRTGLIARTRTSYRYEDFPNVARK